MSNLKIGTLCIWKGPRGDSPMAPPVSATCEVVDSTPWASKVRSDLEVVHFPRHPSSHSSGYWTVYRSSLIPISGPDIDVDTHTSEHYSEGDIVRVGETA